MHIHTQKNDPLAMRTDALLLPVFAGQKTLAGDAGLVNTAMGGALEREVAELHFEAKIGETLVLSTLGTLLATRVILFGLGEKKAFAAEVMRRAMASAVKRLNKSGVRSIAVTLPPTNLKTDILGEALAEGAALAQYHFVKHRTPKKENVIEELVIVDSNPAKVRLVEQGIARAERAVRATVLARDLVNEPASIATPAHLVEHAKQIAAAHPSKIKVTVLDRAACAKKGMGAFLSVAQGAHHEPYFIHLSYKPRGSAKKTIALVGKGITFDSGGLQIKDDKNMGTMKCDMAGAAAVLGVFDVLATMQPNVAVHGVIAATENMPGPGAYKPGDVVRAMNGKTIEIGHTDAEGRVTLADSLSYAAALKPDFMIDLATLTGAAMVALGEEVAALMTNTPKVGERIKAAAETSGERFWELPLVEEYRDLISGTHGDVSNSGSTRYGGSITAGLFLREFVNDVPWAHLDIAGPAWAERESIPYVPKGGTGFGVRTLLALLARI